MCCTGAFLFITASSTGYVYHNLLEDNYQHNETKKIDINHYVQDGIYITVCFIATLFIVSIPCCIIPYREWKKNLIKCNGRIMAED